MLDDDVLTGLLSEAADSFPVPAEGPGFVLEELAISTPRSTPRYVKWTAAAAAVVVGLLIVQSLGGSNVSIKQAPTAAPASTSDLSRMRLDGNGAAGGATGARSPASTWTGSTWAPTAPGALTPGLADSQKAAHGTATGSGTTAAAPEPFADSAKIVKTGSIALIVGDGKVSSVITKVNGIAKGAGGYISDSKSQEYGDDPTSTVTIRVPVDRFETVVQQVRDQVKNGVGKVDSSSTSGQDVTASYSDVAAKIQSLTAARDRFLTILSRANTIGETLSVQQRVDSVQLQIDSLRGRLRVLQDQTSMGTLTVTVSEKAKAETKPHVQSGLSKSFDDAQHGFTSGVESLISHSGRGLLVLIVAAVGLVILRTGWRLARRRLV
jgi:hypothetical protein